jgi:hypothetical protein
MAKTEAICPQNKERVCESGVDIAHIEVEDVPPEIHREE